MSLTEDFAELFAGRTDAYGLENGGRSGEWVDGAFVPWGFAENQWEMHLSGEMPIGVYPMVPSMGLADIGVGPWRCKWGCVDFDVRSDTKPTGDYATEAEAHVAAQNLVLALDAFGITGWIEVTKNRGRHVWVFALQWVPASTMRRALLVACEVAGASVREVNPKQETLEAGQLGNYVRLPYPGGRDPAITLDAGSRVVLMGDGTHMCAEVFVGRALEARVHSEVLSAAAALYKPPPTPPKRVLAPLGEGLGVMCDRALTTRLSGLAYTIFMDGPLDGDRSKALFKLACLCSDSGLTLDEAYAVVGDADARWGKYQGREGPLLRTIERAYERAEARS